MTESEAYSAKAARAGKDIGKKGKNFAKIAKKAAERYGSEERGKKVAGAILKKLRMKEEAEQLGEKAPPGKKFERMVKHIKKGYEPGGLTKQEKGIAYATAWKSYNKAKNEEVELDEAIPKSTSIALVHTASKKIVAKGDKNQMMKKMKELNSKEKGSHHLGSTYRGKVGDTFGEEVESIQESYTLYHSSYTDAVNHAFAHHAKSGLKSSDDDRMQRVGLGSKKPGEGNTTTVNIPATHEKTGKKHMIHIQVYNRGGSTPYELNTYSSTTRSMQKESEQVSELSTELLARYKKAAADQAIAADKKGDFEKGNKRFKGIGKATDKQSANDRRRFGLTKEEEDTSMSIKFTEFRSRLDEASYMGKGNHKPGWMLRADPELARKFKEIEDRKKNMNSLMKKYGGKTGDEIAKMKKEEVEQVDERNKENKVKKNAYVSSIIQKKLHPSVLPSLKYGRQELKKEEVEQVDELKKSTLGSYIKKASSSAVINTRTAAAARNTKPTVYSSSTGDFEHRPDPKPYEKKASKRLAGISRAVNKMAKEEIEQVDELKQSTLGSYIKKASHDVATKSALTRHFATKSRDEKEKQNYTQARKDDETSNKLFNKSWKRRQGIAKAVDRLTKKEVEIS